MEANDGIILRLSQSQLHEVNNGVEKLKEWGELVLSIHTTEDISGLWIRIGNTEWTFDSNTPTLKATPHTFMFAVGGSTFYSVLLAEGTAEEEVSTFEEVLAECTAYEVAGAMNKQGTDEAVAEVASALTEDDDSPLFLSHHPAKPGEKASTSEKILSGAAVVQEKIMASAGWASQKLLEQSQSLQNKTQPAERPVNISPEMSRRVKLARTAAEKGNRAANRVAGGLADVSVKVADSIVRRMGPSSYGQQLSDPSSQSHATKEVASAAVLAAVGIYDTMEQAALLVLRSGGQASSDFIGHKYGRAAGETAHDAARAGISAGTTVMTMQRIGVKKIARRIAKRTAMGLVKSYAGLHPPPQQQGAASSRQLPAGNCSQGVSRASAMQMTQPAPFVESETYPQYHSPFAN